MLFQIASFNNHTIAAQPSPFASTANNIDISSTVGNLSRTNMLPYISQVNGISMLYPFGWTPSLAGLSYPELIRFYSPLENVSDISPAEVTLSITKYVKNITLSEFTNLTLSSLKDSLSNHSQQQLNIKNSGPVRISGNPGYRVVYSLTTSKSMFGVEIMETWTVLGNKLYFISYSADSSKFVKYIPEVNQMLASVRIVHMSKN